MINFPSQRQQRPSTPVPAAAPVITRSQPRIHQTPAAGTAHRCARDGDPDVHPTADGLMLRGLGLAHRRPGVRRRGLLWPERVVALASTAFDSRCPGHRRTSPRHLHRDHRYAAAGRDAVRSLRPQQGRAGSISSGWIPRSRSTPAGCGRAWSSASARPWVTPPRAISWCAPRRSSGSPSAGSPMAGTPRQQPIRWQPAGDAHRRPDQQLALRSARCRRQ